MITKSVDNNLPNKVVVVSLPAGSSDDPVCGPHLHHLLEHLFLEKLIPDKDMTYREWLDNYRITCSATTTRDRTEVWFQSSSDVPDYLFVDAITFLSSTDISDCSIETVTKQIKDEIRFLPNNFVSSSRLSAEFTYWNEINRLDIDLIDTTVYNFRIQLNQYVKYLIDNSVVVSSQLDFPSVLSELKLERTDNPLALNTYKDFLLPNSESGQVIKRVRPNGLQSIVLGLPSPLDAVDRFSLWVLSLMLTRPTRSGLLWQKSASSTGLYHLMSWVNSTIRDATLVIDWFNQSDSYIQYEEFIDVLYGFSKYADIEYHFSRAKYDLINILHKKNSLDSITGMRRFAYELSRGSTITSKQSIELAKSVNLEQVINLLTSILSNSIIYIDSNCNIVTKGIKK